MKLGTMKKILILLLVSISKGILSQPPDKFCTSFGGDGMEEGNGIKLTPANDYIVIGSTTSFGNGGTDAYLVLLDKMGAPVWAKSFGSTGIEVGKSIVVNPVDSGYV